MNNSKKVSLAAAAAGVMSGTAGAARKKAVDELMAGIRDENDKVRAEAWLGAGEVGAAAVKPLAKVMTDKDFEIARAAKRGLAMKGGRSSASWLSFWTMSSLCPSAVRCCGCFPK